MGLNFYPILQFCKDKFLLRQTLWFRGIFFKTEPYASTEFDEKEIYAYKIEGLGKNLIPTSTNFDIIDQFVKVTDKESALMAREISRTEGLFVGYTSGAAFQAVKQYAEMGEFDENSNVVVVFPDHGSRYMSKIYSDEWMQEQGFLDTDNIDDSMKIEVIR